MKWLWIAILCMGAAGCAHQYTPETFSDPYGFFSGIWHGICFPFSLIGCMIFDSVWIVGRPNTGWPYYLGFFIGLCSLGGGGARGGADS